MWLPEMVLKFKNGNFDKTHKAPLKKFILFCKLLIPMNKRLFIIDKQAKA